MPSKKDTFVFPDQLAQTLKANLNHSKGVLPSLRHFCEIKSFAVRTGTVAKDIEKLVDQVVNVLKGKGGTDAILSSVEKWSTDTNSDHDGTVYLHIPNDLAEPDVSVAYTDVGMVETEMGLAGIKAFINAADQTADGKGLGESILNSMNDKGFTADVLIQIVPKLLSKINGDLGNQLTAAASRKIGAIINPMQTQMFTGIGLREFTLSWTLSPKTKSEAAAIYDIIHFFRTKTRPKAGSSRFLLEFPHEFQVSFKTGERNKEGGRDNKHLFKSKKCVISNVSINDTPSGRFAAFGQYTSQDGMPVERTLSLTFKEMEIVTSTDVQEGKAY
jgi:hypothetical protein